jgi:SAM-dependent methyltransferase/uncharacterized protein YbaR (Trm112 family)
MAKKQDLSNKTGEIDFRKKLALQQTGGEKVLDDEFNQQEIEKMLLERMETTKKQIQALKDKGVLMTPYLELGAERGQRALVMENDFSFNGSAVDISYDMLLTCSHYAQRFNKSKVPLRICCDAYNLPFLSNSLPFVFCYETLHHFPAPAPIVKEISRVLMPGGYFFFAEEPCRGFLQLKLFKNKNRIYSEKSLKRGFIKRVIEHFFYQPSCNEVDHGIIENDKISLLSWRRALSIFEINDVELETANSLVKTELFHPKSYIKFLLASLIGGGVKGLCKKKGEVEKNKINQNYDVFRCPDCAQEGKESKLQASSKLYLCPTCARKFPIINGVIFLFLEDEFKKLYPEYLNKN